MRATNLANQFAAHGYQATILVTKEMSQQPYYQADRTVELVSLRQFVEEHSTDHVILKDAEARQKRIRNLKRVRLLLRGIHRFDLRLQNEVAGIRRSEALRKYLLQNGDSILIPFGYACYEMAIFASQGLNCKLVYAERNAAELECPSGAEEREFAFKLLQKADGAVLQTQDEMDFYRACGWKNAAVIHNPIRPGLPAPWQGARRNTVVNFCRVSKQKNLPLLIEAFERFHRDYSAYTLEIYGNVVSEEEEALLAEIRESVKNAGQEAYIRLLPSAADVHERVKDCAMFVSSSDYEGLSNSMIEAMAIGLPCVCTDCLGGGAREMIEDGENGLLVPRGDVNSLYLGMKKMANDKALAERCGNNAAKNREEMGAASIGNRWIQLIERI